MIPDSDASTKPAPRMLPEPRDMLLADEIARRWHSPLRDPVVKAIKLDCFNRSEAEMMRGLMKRLHPEVPMVFAWLFNR